MQSRHYNLKPIKQNYQEKQKQKIRNNPDEMFAGHCGSFGVALREGCKGGFGLTTSGQKKTPQFLDTGGTGKKADGDGKESVH